MEFSDLLFNLIGSYCFPIAMCVAIFWKMDKDGKAHKEEMDKMSEALNNNTLTMQKLVDKLEASR